MKKFTAMLLALLLVTASACASTTTDLATGADLATATNQTPGVFELAGAVVKLEDGLATLRDADGVLYDVNLTEETLLEGAESLHVGDYVHVQYDGKLTRSIPAMLTAQKVTCYAITGVVTELSEDGFLLEQTVTEEAADEAEASAASEESAADAPQTVTVQVLAEAEKLHGVMVGQTVTVYFNGVMTMSLPGQINADYIRLPQLTGTVGELTEDGFLLTDADGAVWQIVVDAESTVVYAEATAGESIRVSWDGTSTRSNPPQIAAVELLPVEENDEAGGPLS